MIYETIETAMTNPLVSRSSLVREALIWAKSIDLNSELGRFDLRGNDLFAMVQKREPKPREERVDVEAHRDYVDLQYCFGGGEYIDWYPADGLKPTEEYQKEDDYQLFERPREAPMSLLMKPGTFTLLFPGDAHVPMVSDGENSICHMIVFKIKVQAIREEFAQLTL